MTWPLGAVKSAGTETTDPVFQLLRVYHSTSSFVDFRWKLFQTLDISIDEDMLHSPLVTGEDIG